MDSSRSGQGPDMDSREDGNELQGPIEGGDSTNSATASQEATCSNEMFSRRC
jgi:hypothetical protein